MCFLIRQRQPWRIIAIGRKMTTGGRSGKLPSHHQSGYGAWRNMIQRCSNPNSPDYRWYGGRGITICESWQGKNGFNNFIAEMGRRPKGTYLVRVNLNGNYEKSNCLWSHEKKQTPASRRDRILTERLCVMVEKKIRDALEVEQTASGTLPSVSVRRALSAYFHLEPPEEG